MCVDLIQANRTKSAVNNRHQPTMAAINKLCRRRSVLVSFVPSSSGGDKRWRTMTASKLTGRKANTNTSRPSASLKQNKTKTYAGTR